MVYGYVHTPQIGQLSRWVRDWETGPDDPAREVNLWESDADTEAHPLVLQLAAHDKNGVSAALAYLAEGSESDAPAIIRWMMDDAFKGLFDNEEAFARDQFGDAFADHIEAWEGREGIGFPLDLDMVEAVDWEYIGEQLTYGDTWCFVAVDAGVYVFDVSISIADYREEN